MNAARSRRAPVAWIVPLLLLVLLGLQLKRAGDLVRAQRLLWAVEARTLSMIRGNSLHRAPVEAHLTALADAARLDPAEVAIRVAMGSQYFLLRRYEEALVEYRVANRLEHRPEIFLNMGKAQQMLGRNGAAVRLYMRAVRLDPALADEVPENLRRRVLETLRRDDAANRAQQDRQVDP